MGDFEGREAPALLLSDAPRTERRDAAEHRQRILDTARVLFDQYGLESVSMHQIAQAAGVGQGTLYRRYAHKGELCSDLFRDSGQRFFDDVEAYLSESGGSTSAIQRLDGVVTRIVNFIDDNARFLGAITDAACGERRATKFQSPFYQWLHETISCLLREAMPERVSSVDITYAADGLLAVLNPDLYLFQRNQRGLAKDDILQSMRNIYIGRLCNAHLHVSNDGSPEKDTFSQ